MEAIIRGVVKRGQGAGAGLRQGAGVGLRREVASSRDGAEGRSDTGWGWEEARSRAGLSRAASNEL